MKTYYDVLGVPRDADEQAIKKAYRKKAMYYHPDRNKDPDAAKHFMEVNEAYECLSNPLRKSQYDSQFRSDMNSHSDTYTDTSYYSTYARERAYKAQNEYRHQNSYDNRGDDDIYDDYDTKYDYSSHRREDSNTRDNFFSKLLSLLFFGNSFNINVLGDCLKAGLIGYLVVVCLLLAFTGIGAIPASVGLWLAYKGLFRDYGIVGCGPMLIGMFIWLIIILFLFAILKAQLMRL